MRDVTRRMVLACPGRLDPGALAAARRAGAAEVVTVTLDLGQGRQLETIRDAALAAGAARAHVLDVRDRFARDFVLPALQAGALVGTHRPVVATLADALGAATLVEIAAMEQAQLVGVPARTSGELGKLLAGLRGGFRVVQIDGPADPAAPAAAWPSRSPAEYRPSVSHPGTPASASVGFDRGIPVSLNGIAMPLAELATSLAALAGAESVPSPLPALQDAHTALRNLVADFDLARFADDVAQEYRTIVDESRWFSPLRDALDAFVQHIQPLITGTVRITMQQGTWSISQAVRAIDSETK